MGSRVLSCRVVAIVMVAFMLPGRSLAAEPGLVDASLREPQSPAATTWNYPSGSCNTTLQACINAATAGDTIRIAAGRITETLTLNKAVSLIGAGPYATVLVAPASQRVLLVSGTITPGTVISGLMVTGGNAVPGLDFGGGIDLVSPAQPLLVGLVISANQATTGGGVASDVPVQIMSSLFYGNVATAGGGGLRGSGALTDTQFISNTGSGGGIWAQSAPVSIVRGDFERNFGKTQGGALVVINSNLAMTDTNVFSNTSTGSAGGVEVTGVGITTLSGGRFLGNHGVNGGAVVANALTFSGTVFANNTSTGWGGAVSAGLWVVGQNSRFEANHAVGATGYGGAIYAATTMTLTNLVIVSNTADYEGGGVESVSGGRLTAGHLENNSSPNGYGGGLSLDSSPSYAPVSLDLSGTDFISNSAYYGGGLYVYQPIVITGGTFTHNSATSSGGGLYAYYDLGLSGANFISNTAGYGAGLYVDQGAAVITGSTFIRNSAASQGGGVNVNNYGMIASSTVFSGNIAVGYDGGGAYVYGGVAVTLGHVEANHSGRDGGGLYIGGSSTHNVLTQTDFISNTAGEDGGGIYISGQTVLHGGRFERNIALRYGGGWYFYYGAVMTDTVTISNTATWGGGGYADGGAELHGAQLAGNTATTGGGGGLYSLGQTEVYASRVTGNSAPQGGGLYFWGSGDIVNSLLADNQASAAGADLYVTFNGSASIVFSTIAAAALYPRQAIVLNSGSLHMTDTIVSNYAVGISVTTGAAFENYNLFYGNTITSVGSVTHGAGSRSGQNPLFVNSVAGDYHLTAGSPAIDHGVIAGITVDFDGDPRPLGAGYDIGFDEYRALPLNHKVYLPIALK